MAVDRNGQNLEIGQNIELTKGMSVAGVTKGIVTKIDGAYILVEVIVPDEDSPVQADRYGCEMTIVVP